MESVQLLLKAGVHIDDPSRTGITSRTIARRGGHDELPGFLLTAGANFNGRGVINSDLPSMTPLQAASHRGNTKLVRILLQANAGVNALASWCSAFRAPLFYSGIHMTSVDDRVSRTTL